MKIRCLLVGAPGSGKGTQAEYLSQKLSIPIVTTSSVIRASLNDDSPMSVKVRDTINQGKLIDDDMMWQLLQHRVCQDDCKAGIILDGFPRNQKQLDMLLDAGVKIDTVLYLQVSDEVIVDRLSGRRVHLPSGRTYHVLYNPPKQDGLDDITSESLVQRDDDTPEVVQKRLAIFHEQTMPVIKWAQGADAILGKLLIIDASKPVAEVREEIDRNC